MAGAFQSSDDDLVAGINVTPLVDVVLVLLVIFLMTAPVIYQSSMQVQLPTAKTGQAQVQEKVLDFVIKKDGSISLSGSPLTLGQIATAIREKKSESTSALSASISADNETQHGLVVKLMDALRAAGILRLAINVQNE